METKQKKQGDNTRRGTRGSAAKQPQTRQGRPASQQTRQRPAGERRADVAQEVYRPTDQRRRPGASQTPERRRAQSSTPRKRPQDTAISDRQRQTSRAKQAQRRRRRTPRRPTPAVVYTQPAAFNRNRLLMQMLIVTAVVLALVMGLSIFFRVKNVTVSGANAYSAWTIREASGIEEGDKLLTFSRARAAAKIEAELPYVKDVRIGIKLPDTVNIIIEEYDVVYSIQSSDSLWWLITSGGKVLEQTDGGTANSYTKVLGVTLESPVVNELGVAAKTEAEVPDTTEETTGESATVSAVVTAQDRLDAALQILQALERNDVVGEAASVDVSDLSDIILWYGTQFQVELGDVSNMVDKIASMKAAINDEELKNGYGILDVSFTYWEDMVGYTPFE